MNRRAQAMTHAIALALGAALLTGCAVSPTPRYDQLFGDAVREARERMTINPQAGGDALAGIDGHAAREAQLRYHETFKSPPPVVNVINIGGQISSGSEGR